MRAIPRNELLKDLLGLRYMGVDGRAFHYGYVSGVLSGFLMSGLISLDEYGRLSDLKRNAWQHNVQESGYADR